jgi:hypothetical protein
LDPGAFDWWSAFVRAFTLWLPIQAVGVIIRAHYYAAQQFRALARIDVALHWMLLLPLVFLGSFYSMPYLAWGAFPVVELVFIGISAWKIFPQSAAALGTKLA